MLKQIAPPALLDPVTLSVAVVFDGALVADAAAYGLALPPALARAVPERQAEFLAGRYCAREALRELGCGDVGMLGLRADRAPQWPAGVVGSITHTGGFAWAAATRAAVCCGVGIDSETIPSAATAADVGSVICTARDRATLGREVVPRWGETTAVGLALSVRESFYKCLAVCAADKPEPGDLVLANLDMASGTFQLELTRRLSTHFDVGHRVDGCLAVTRPLVHTAIAW